MSNFSKVYASYLMGYRGEHLLAVVCGARKGRMRCERPAQHEGNHRCDNNDAHQPMCWPTSGIKTPDDLVVNKVLPLRLQQAHALGVHHRTTSKPPLMSSVAVTAELRAMSAPFCDVVLLNIPILVEPMAEFPDHLATLASLPRDGRPARTDEQWAGIAAEMRQIGMSS